MANHIIRTGRLQCPNVDNPCHRTQQCDDSVIGCFQCRCDPNKPNLAEINGACLNPDIWRAAGPNSLGFKAVHLANILMYYEEAKEYCDTIGGVLPNYYTREVEQAVNTVPASEMLVLNSYVSL